MTTPTDDTRVRINSGSATIDVRAGRRCNALFDLLGRGGDSTRYVDVVIDGRIVEATGNEDDGDREFLIEIRRVYLTEAGRKALEKRR